MGKQKKSDVLNEALDLIINGDDSMSEVSKPSPNRLKYSYEDSPNSSSNSFMKQEIDSYNFLSDVPEQSESDQWMSSILSTVSFSKKRGKKSFINIFDEDGKKKKKKNKKVDSQGREIVDYGKQMEPELNMYRNLLKDQNMFTESLQKEYDAIRSSKSLSRGVNKSMSDMIANITSARSLSMQLVEKNINAKKIIAELNMKQSKEAAGIDGENMSDFAASFLKQMINERGAVIGAGIGDGSVANYDDDSFSDMFDTSIENDPNRPDEVDRYLKYENQNVTVYVVISGNDVENYEFLAKNENGDILEDYPLPNKTKISVNRSTGIATDTYGKKYPILWE